MIKTTHKKPPALVSHPSSKAWPNFPDGLNTAFYDAVQAIDFVMSMLDTAENIDGKQLYSVLFPHRAALVQYLDVVESASNPQSA